MPTLLIVDDSLVDRKLAVGLLQQAGLEVVTANNGKSALEQMRRQLPDLVLTDLQMPELDGLKLVKAIRAKFPSIPVVLMTAYGNEEVALDALASGAASFVPKTQLATDLLTTVSSILDVAQAKRDAPPSFNAMAKIEATYVLGNTVEGLNALIGQVKEQLLQMKILGAVETLQVSTALYEAIINAIEHGNLELTASQRNQDGPYYREVVEVRGQESPFAERRVYVTVSLTRDEAHFIVRDEGGGYDPKLLDDPRSPENVAKTEGRGLFLIQTFMDEVSFNETGNQIEMIKRRCRV